VAGDVLLRNPRGAGELRGRGGFALAPARVQPFAPQQRPPDEQLTLAGIEVQRLVKLMGLQPGMRVADVGAGLGAWTLRFSQWTGATGHVYATDIGDEQLAALRALVALFEKAR
jgi:predicted methyltransferase